MARPNVGPNVDAFDACFRRADLVRDGRISGNEVVACFQGSNLPKHVLAQSSLTKAPASGSLWQASSLLKPNQFDSAQATSTLQGPAKLGIHASSANQVQPPWPRITQSDIQRYNSIFVKVDTDRAGKITGEQARDLFLSWRLPRGFEASLGLV